MGNQNNENIRKYPRPEIDLNPKFPPLKEIKDKTKIDVRYALISPFAFAHIYWNPKISEVVYEVEEPILDQKENSTREQIILAMREIVSSEEIVSKDKEKLLDYIDRRFKLFLTEFDISISHESYKKIFYYLIRDFVGFGKADPLLKDYFVEDVECNGINTPVYIVHRKFRNLKTNISYKSMDNLTSFVEKLAQRSGRYISYAQPILDSSLPDGSRVNATYTSDITSKGPTFTIRKFTKKPWTPLQLMNFETLSPEMLAYFWLLIEYKMNILVAGGTASGKTSLLNALSFFIPPEARVVSIEDTRELNIPRENWLPSVVRGATGVRGTGEVDLFSLLRASFRQNPDYVIVGEVRGKEAYVLFQGMASGHSSMGTIHADSIDTVIKRLESPPIELSPTLVNVLDCVCIMTHAIVKKEETRKLREIVEIVNVTPDGVALTNTPFMWNPSDNRFYFKKDSRIFEKIKKRYGISAEELELEFRKRVSLLYQLSLHKITDFKKFQEIINEYSKNPEKTLAKYKA